MPFDVFPNPQTNPLNIPAGGASALIPITERLGEDSVGTPDEPATEHLTTMFIRLAMLGATPANRPSIFLKANTGAAVEVMTETAPGVAIFDGTNITEAANAFRLLSAPNNIYLFKVLVFITGRSWQIQIKNNDTIARDFTWVVADSLEGSRQPWIDVTLPAGGTTSFDVLTNQTPGPVQILTVNNYGTGILTISDPVGPIAGSGGFGLAEVPGPIPPNSSSSPLPAGSGELKVSFTSPAAIGTSNLTHSLTTNDGEAETAPRHNKQFLFTATTRKLEVALMLDASGSMAYMPNGSPTVVSPDESRWGRLKSAARQFLDLLGSMGAGEGRFAVGMFPDITTGVVPAPSPSADDFQAPTDITGAATATAKTSLDSFTPVQRGGATPIGFGIGRAIGTVASGFGYFLGPDTATDRPLTFNKRFLVLMSDGAHNSGPPNPPDFYGTTLISFKTKKVKAITVAYGEPGASAFQVDHTLLTTISAESAATAAEATSLTLDAGADDAGSSLKKQFRDVLKTGLSLDPFTDPGGLLTENAPSVRHQIVVTPYDTKVAFVVNWKTPNAERVNVFLLTPNCEPITPQSVIQEKNVFYSNEQTYALFVVNHDYLRNASDPANPRYGVWRLVINGNFPSIIMAADGENAEAVFNSEPYDYEVITESRLKLGLSTERGVYFAGDQIKLTALLTADGKGIPHATVTARVSAPGQGAANWLAQNRVTTAEFQAAAERLSGEDVTMVGIKAFALRNKGLRFNLATQTRTLQMTDAANQGIYTATFDSTVTPGTYDFYVTAIGQTDDGVTFRREKRLQVRVEVRPDPKFTLFDIVHRQVFENNQTFNIADIRVIPRDRFGNVVLEDTTISSRVAITAQGGRFTGPLVGNLDGSYTRSLRYAQGTIPAIGLTVDGQKVVQPSPLTPIEQLRYVDRVIAFKLGGEAEQGANKHTDPKAALGDVRPKPADEFVSLGALGALTLGLEGQLIQAEGDDDLTVFVKPDEDMRAYKVEALPVSALPTIGGSKPTWISLGDSPGVTQAFSLSRAGINKAIAIRITDQSGRTRDSNLDPISTPGVSVVGLGVKKSSRAPGGKTGWQELLDQLLAKSSVRKVKSQSSSKKGKSAAKKKSQSSSKKNKSTSKKKGPSTSKKARK